MRKKYIEDNDEQDPALIAKVLPYYKKTGIVLGGTQIAMVVYSSLFCLSVLGIDYVSYDFVREFVGEEATIITGVVLFLFSLLSLWLFWTFTILAPGSYALVRALPVLVSHRWVIKLNTVLFLPWVRLGLTVTRKIFDSKGIPFRNEVEFTYSEDEIRCIVEESHNSGRVNALESTLIKNSLDFTDLMVRDVMVPRNEMVVLDLEDDIDTMRRIVLKANHTCYPVCLEDKDQILGFVHVKNFLEGLSRGESNLKKIMREILFVPEVMPAASLLQMMKNRRTYMAIVVDEYGGTVGLISLQDLIEELVGEIPEFMDQRPYEIVRREDGSYEFSGTVSLEDVEDRLDVEFDEESKDTTIAGFIFSRLERIPKAGDTITYSGWQFKVVRMTGFRIMLVRAEKTTDLLLENAT